MQKKTLLRGYLKYSLKRVVVFSMVVSAGLFVGSWILNQPSEFTMRQGLWLALPALPLITVINLRSAWLRGFHWNFLSQLPDKLIRPAILALALWLLFTFWKNEVPVSWVILASVVSIFIAALINHRIVRKRINTEVAGIPPAFEKIQWRKVALSLLLVNGLYFYLSQLQIIMLGTLRGSRETGIFAVASRLSDLEGYMLFAMNVVLAPIISRLYAEKDMAGLQRVITGSLRLGFLFSLPLILAFLLWPEFFLKLFGDEFSEGKFALIILTLSQVVNFATGSVGYLLTMTGHHRSAMVLLLLCALLSTVLSLLLIPQFGVAGAAIAASVNNVVLNILMAIEVRRKTGINSTLLSFK